MEKKYLYIGIILTAIGFLGSIAVSMVIIGMALIIYGKLSDVERARPRPQPVQQQPQQEDGPF